MAKNEIVSGADVSKFKAILESEAAKQGIANRLAAKIPPDMFVRAAMGALMKPGYLGDKLRECAPASVLVALYDAAQYGLVPSDGRGLAYLVPFKGQCTLMIGYRGLAYMAVRSGHVKSIFAEVVCTEDEFEFSRGLEPNLKHKPLCAPADDGSNVIGAYAVAVLADGSRVFSFIWKNQIEKRRDTSKTKDRDDSPWKTWWTEMAQKTAVRHLLSRGLAYMPGMDEVLRADGGMDDEAEFVESTVIESPSASSTEAVVEQAIAAAAAEPAAPTIVCRKCLAKGQPADGPCGKCGDAEPWVGKEA